MMVFLGITFIEIVLLFLMLFAFYSDTTTMLVEIYGKNKPWVYIKLFMVVFHSASFPLAPILLSIVYDLS